MRFSLVRLHSEISQWQVHAAECQDVFDLARNGAFAAMVNAESAEEIVKNEMAARAEQGLVKNNYKIMGCCNSANRTQVFAGNEAKPSSLKSESVD